MLSLTLALFLAQSQPAIRRSTPASDDPGMVVRQTGTVTVNCANCGNIFLPDGGSIGSVTQGRALDGGTGWGVFIEGGNLSVTAGISFDGGSIGYMRMPDGGPLEVYTTNAGGSSGGGWEPDGGYIGLVGLADGGGVFVTNSSLAVTGPLTDAQLRATAVPVSASSLPLPSGAATEATLSTRVADSTITARLNTLGQKTSANSAPVVLSSDQTAIPITDNGGSLTVDGTVAVSGTVTTSGTTTASQGTPAATANRWPVQLTDGTDLALVSTGGALLTDSSATTQPVSAATLPLPTGAATSALQTTGNSSLSSIDTKTPALVSGRVPVDGSGVTQPVSGSVTVTQGTGTNLHVVVDSAPTTTVTGTVTANAGTGPWPVTDNGGSLTVDGTVAATQSGTWNVTNISGTVSLPTGAATETTLGTRLAETTFTGRFPASATLADTTANPSLTASASYLMGYNGTTWDRLRKSASGLLVDIQNTSLAVTQSGTWNVGQSGTWTVGVSAGTNYIGKTRLTDGSLDVSLLNSAPGSDTGQVAVPVRIISSLAAGGSGGGTSSNFSAAFPSAGTAAGFSDGTNMETARVFDADTGGGTQNVLGTSIRVSASGGSTEAAAGAGTTSTSTLRVVLPTDQTAIPVTDNGSSLTVDGTVALSGTSAVNVSQVGGNAVNVGSGAAGTGTQRVILATDQSVVPINDNGGSLTVDGTVGISGTVAATQSGTWSVRAQDGSGNALASSTTTPAGTEQALITRNIPSGTQTISGTVTANAGTGPFPVSDNGGSLTVDGTVAVSAVSGSVTVAQATASNLRAQTASESATGSAVPATAGAVGMSDGTNLRIPQVYDTNNDVATEWTTGVVLRAAVFGGSQGYGLGIDGAGNLGLATWNLNKLTNTVTSSAVTCATTATAAPTTPSTDRTTLTLYNNSSVTIYIGGSGVTTSNGIPLLPGASFTDDTQRGAYYCRVASGTADLRVMEQ